MQTFLTSLQLLVQVKEAPKAKKGRLRRALSDSDEENGARRQRVEGDNTLVDSDADMEEARVTLEDSDADERMVEPVVKRRAKQSRLAESDSE